MTQIESIKQSELTASEREVLAADKERWNRMGAGAHLDEWLAYGPGLQIRRRLAMRIAFVNRPEGKGYVLAYSQLLTDDGINIKDKSAMTAFSAVQWIYDDPERMRVLREIRDAMTPGERARLNSPISARQRIEKVLKARSGGDEAAVKQSPVALLKQALVKKEHEIAHLQEQLAAAETRADGSLFDLKRDNADDIGRALADNVSEHKFRNIVKSATERYKAKQKPAG